MIQTVTNTRDSGAGSLRDAMNRAFSGDTIKFQLPASSTISLSKPLEIPIGKSLTIEGAGAPNLTITGNNVTRIFQVYSHRNLPTTLTLKNLTLTRGKTTGRGGAINTDGEMSNIILESVKLNNNAADLGGGAVYIDLRGNLNINNSSFHQNTAIVSNDERSGGAISFFGPNKLTVKNSEFVGNRGINGGAIYNLNGELFIQNTKFLNNQTTDARYDKGALHPDLRGYGGAVYTDRASSRYETYGSVKIYNSLFQNNKGKGEGGAVYLYIAKNNEVAIDSSTFENNEVVPLPGGNIGNGGAIDITSNESTLGAVISNSTFANNKATGQGGAFWKYYTPTTIINSTFYNNRAENLSDINKPYVVGGAATFYGPASVINSTFANNHAAWVAGAIAADNNNIKVKNTIFYYNTATNGTKPWKIQYNTNRLFINEGGNIQYPDLASYQDNYAVKGIKVIDPKLGSLQNNGGPTKTMALLSGSPAINQGINQNSPILDQRGNLRGGKIDVGAYETTTVPLNASIAVKQDKWIADNTTQPINFGVTTIGKPIIKTFQIKNTSTNPLYLGYLQIPQGFSLVGNSTPIIPPLGQTFLQVKLNANTAGYFNSNIAVYSNDKNNNPFNFPVTANVIGIINGNAGNDKINEISSLKEETDADELINGLQGNDSLFGSNGNDTINGGPGNDNLFGGSGNDSLIGGAGNDTYYLDSPQDIILETSTNTKEIDSVVSAVDYSLSANLENLNLNGSSPIDGQGNQLNNNIYGNQFDNEIKGFEGNDYLVGNEGNDYLAGGSGNDTLSGGAGNDQFYLDYPGSDVVRDFEGNKDKILVSSALAKNQLIPATKIKANQLIFGTQATGNQAQFLFNGKNGQLSLDADGIGLNAPVTLAFLTNKPLISYQDIQIVA